MATSFAPAGNPSGVVLFSLNSYFNCWACPSGLVHQPKKQAAAVALNGKTQAEGQVAIYGAFSLFLNFINLFLFLLRIFGSSR